MFSYQKNFFNPTQPVDEAQFYALVRATQWAEDIDMFRQTGDPSLKRKLPAFIFQSTFEETTSRTGLQGAWRKQAATRLTGLVVMDVDHVSDPREVYTSWLKAHDLKQLGILLVYITPSGKGLKIVFKADAKKGNLIDNQHAMAKVLGVEVDESCKDASRMSFICKESDILYIDKELFSYENKEFAQKYNDAYRAGRSGATVAAEVAAENDNRNDDDDDGNDDDDDDHEGKGADTTWRGHDVQKIIDARYEKKLPCAADSNRHNESLRLASDLLILFDGDKKKVERIVRAQPWVKEIISERDENVTQTVESAAQRMAEREKKYLTLHPSKAMLDAIEEATELTYDEIVTDSATRKQQPEENPQIVTLEPRLEMWGKQIEELFEEYPILRDITKGLKRNQYPAALFVGGGLMMTLMTRCTYRFYHRPEELRRLNCSALIIGDPASGKSFATRLFKLLASPIVEADKVGKAAINAYREQMKMKGANKEKPAKPKVIVRVHPARTSNAQFIQDMVNSVEDVNGEKMQLHMLTFDTELDNTLCLQKGGSWIDKQSMELKAFHNEEDGQAYSNVDSVMQDFNVTWNFIYTGTPIALKKKVNDQNFGSGLATRLTVIPLPSTNFEMIERESAIDLESDERLVEWARKLDRMKGELSVENLVDELYDWTARRMMDAQENDSKADEMLLKRCAYHALNFAAPFVVMRHWDRMQKDGEYWCGKFATDETDWRLAELLANIQFACQRYYFGAMAENYFDNKTKEAAMNVQHRQRTIEAFNRLPEEFTVEDVVRCFQIKCESGARVKIKRLLDDHLVEKVREIQVGKTHKAIYRKTDCLML